LRITDAQYLKMILVSETVGHGVFELRTVPKNNELLLSGRSE